MMVTRSIRRAALMAAPACLLASSALASSVQADPAAPPSVVVTAKRPIKACAEKDKGCINEVVKEVWTRFPQQLGTICDGWQIQATQRAQNLEAFLADSSSPLQAADGATVSDRLPAPESAICSYKPQAGVHHTTAETWLPWSRVPSDAEIAAVWPAKAHEDSGDARLYCGLNVQGRLIKCSLSDENPDKQGFGKAALALTDKFQARVDPSAKDDLPRLKVDISVHFARASAARPDVTLDWVALPNPAKTAGLYPAEAAKAGVATGVGQVDCRVGEDGALGDCKLVGEEPAGLGFGSAALAAAPDMHANLWTRDGQRAPGARVVVPLRFNAPSAGPAAGE